METGVVADIKQKQVDYQTQDFQVTTRGRRGSTRRMWEGGWGGVEEEYIREGFSKF